MGAECFVPHWLPAGGADLWSELLPSAGVSNENILKTRSFQMICAISITQADFFGGLFL